MLRFTAIAKQVGQLLFMVSALFLLSLIPLLIAVNLLSLFGWLDDRGWSHLALLIKIVAIVLAVCTIILAVCGLVAVFVFTVQEIRGFESKDESPDAS